MTTSEYKAWFEGYTENMTRPPSAKQWERIKARVKEIDGMTIIRSAIYWNPYAPVVYSGTTSDLLGYDYGNATSGATMLANMGRQDAKTDA